MPAVSDSPILLYDGDCNLCNRLLRFVLKRDRKATFRFGALLGEYGQSVRARHPIAARTDSIIWIEQDHLWLKSDAAIRVGLYLGGAWGLAARVLRVVPHSLRDAAYDFIAKRRTRWFGRATDCLIPTPEQRARSLD